MPIWPASSRMATLIWSRSSRKATPTSRRRSQRATATWLRRPGHADTYFSDKHTEADNYEAEVQKRASTTIRRPVPLPTTSTAQQVRDNLENQAKVIEGNIKGLKQFETEYRARLTDFLGQLVDQVSDTNNYDQDPQDNND